MGSIVSGVHWLDQHALGLQLLLLLTVAGVLHARRKGQLAWLWHDQAARSHVHACVLQGAALLGAVVLAVLAVSVQAAQGAEAAQGVWALDLAVQHMAQGLPAALLPVVHGFTWLGDLRVMAAVGAAVTLWLLWQRQGLQLLAWLTAVAGTGLWTRALKNSMERDRPLGGLVHESGFSFPSGHSAGTAAIFGMLAWLLVRRLTPQWQARVWALAALLAVGTALSRVLLSVHYASDVVAGLSLGMGWTAMVLWVVGRVECGDHAVRGVLCKAQSRS